MPSPNDRTEDRLAHRRRRWTLAALALCWMAPAAAQPAVEPSGAPLCGYDLARMLALDIRRFDQDMQGGWRELAARAGCREAAADLIRHYRTMNGLAAPTAERADPERQWRPASTLYFHEAQLRSELGQYARARALFLLAQHRSQSGWNLYVQATVAFIDGDLPRLRRIRRGYARLPVPADYEYIDLEGVLRRGRPAVWPDNLEVVDGLIRCFGRPYAIAYGSAACRTPARRGRRHAGACAHAPQGRKRWRGRVTRLCGSER